MGHSANGTGLVGNGQPAGESGGVKGGGGGGGISDSMACASVLGVLQGGDGGTDRSQVIQLDSGPISYETAVTGGYSLRCMGCLRGR